MVTADSVFKNRFDKHCFHPCFCSDFRTGEETLLTTRSVYRLPAYERLKKMMITVFCKRALGQI